MHLADALIVWIDAGIRMSDLSKSRQDNTINLMEQVTFRRSVTYAEINVSKNFRTKLEYTFLALWNCGFHFRSFYFLGNYIAGSF